VVKPYAWQACPGPELDNERRAFRFSTVDSCVPTVSAGESIDDPEAATERPGEAARAICLKRFAGSSADMPMP
jgi:hypothetical protein